MNDSGPPYLPIDCDRHSQLELLAMRRQWVRLRCGDAHGRPIALCGEVSDVLTRDGAEYLILRDADRVGHAVRLDRLHELRDRDARPIWCQKSPPAGASGPSN